MALGSASVTAALRVAVRITFDRHLEAALQIGNALVNFVAQINILSIAKQGTFWLAASGLASARQLGFARGVAFGLAVYLAGHVGIRGTRTAARSVAFRRAIGSRLCSGTLCVTITGTGGLAGRTAPVVVVDADAGGVAACATVGLTGRRTIEFGWRSHALRLASPLTRQGALGVDRHVATAVAIDIEFCRALRREIQRGTRRCASPFDTHFTLQVRIDFEGSTRIDEASTRWRRNAQKCCRKCNGKNGGKECTHVWFS